MRKIQNSHLQDNYKNEKNNNKGLHGNMQRVELL